LVVVAGIAQGGLGPGPVSKPDGPPRYGSEPDKGTDPSGNTIGRTGSKACDDRNDGTGALDANKEHDRKCA